MSNIDSKTLDNFRRLFHETEKYTTDGPIYADRGRCWPWKKHNPKHRFGQFGFLDAHRDTDENGDVLRAQRRPYEVAWELMYGAIPEDKKLVKRCPLDYCCNPMHVDAVAGKKRKRREVRPKTDEQIVHAEVVDDDQPEMITDAEELRAITDGEPVTPEGAAVMTPIQTTPVVQVFDSQTGQRLADRPVPTSNVTRLVQRGAPELHVLAGQMTHDNVGDTIKTVIDGQVDREGKIVEIAHTINGVKLCLAVRDDEIVRRFRQTETVRIVERRQHDVIPGFGETP